MSKYKKYRYKIVFLVETSKKMDPKNVGEVIKLHFNSLPWISSIRIVKVMSSWVDDQG